MNSQQSSSRIRSVDILRGIVMVIMALDHTRDYFTNFYGDPTDLTTATTSMFFTRWITHFCAPVFIFLAGTSAYLSLAKKQNKKEASLFLLKRGIWLIIVEFTLVRTGWFYNFDYSLVVVQVIWAIGISMIFLSVLIQLPYKLILTIGLLMIFGHNLLDGLTATPDSFGATVWLFLHQGGMASLWAGNTTVIIYPIIPWIGVMATGYCFGKLLQQEKHKRNKSLYLIGGSAIVLFIILRTINIYGDPTPWDVQDSTLKTILSFINVEKYPPSLLYLLITLSISILSMPLLEVWSGRVERFFTVFGRVPMFYYIAHIYLIHLIAIVWAFFKHVPVYYFTDNNMMFAAKPDWGFSLPVVYTVWIAVVLLLYFPCLWFMYIKLNHRKWWLSYL